MSFVKALKCYNCSITSSLREENFPEDLYDLITHYKIHQLIWLCKVCKNYVDQKTTTTHVLSKQNEIKDVKDNEGLKRLERTITSDCDMESTKYNSHEKSSEDIVDSGNETESVQSWKTLSLPENPKNIEAAYKDCHEILNKIKIIHEKEADLLSKQNKIKYVKDIEGLKRLEHTLTSECEKESTKYNSQEKSSEDIVDSGRETESVRSLTTLSENPKGNKDARKCVHEVLNKIKITPAEAADNKQIIIRVLDILINDMKKDEEFSIMFNRFFYTGSSYNDLRIIAATEYDINVVLYLPNSMNLIPCFCDENFSFGKLKWERSDPNIPVSVLKFLKKNSIDNYLHPEMVLSWFQKHLDLSLKRIDAYTSKVQNVKTSSSGPARTLVINTTLGYSISIDLAPVFEFHCLTLHSTPVFEEIMQINEDVNKNSWFMVPKPCQGEIENISLANSKLSWRVVFPQTEKQILIGKECAKNVIKILKILRDKRNWKNIASYYMNMVVILEIRKNPSAKHWSNGYVFERTLDALKQLKTYLKNQNLPHFLSNQNLLFRLKNIECINYSNYLDNIIPEIESNPKKLVELLL